MVPCVLTRWVIPSLTGAMLAAAAHGWHAEGASASEQRLLRRISW
jgi:hypothetical protein